MILPVVLQVLYFFTKTSSCCSAMKYGMEWILLEVLLPCRHTTWGFGTLRKAYFNFFVF